MLITMDIPRPDVANVAMQGPRGPFFPLLGALNLSADINTWMMHQKLAPWLYESGIRYKEQMPTKRGEEFLNWEQLYQKGEGDCDQIAPYRVAELRVRCGVPAKPCIKWKWVWVTNPAMYRKFGHNRPFRLMLVHVLACSPIHPGVPGLWRYDPRVGWVDDPSKVLGMSGDYQ